MQEKLLNLGKNSSESVSLSLEPHTSIPPPGAQGDKNATLDECDQEYRAPMSSSPKLRYLSGKGSIPAFLTSPRSMVQTLRFRRVQLEGQESYFFTQPPLIEQKLYPKHVRSRTLEPWFPGPCSFPSLLLGQRFCIRTGTKSNQRLIPLT